MEFVYDEILDMTTGGTETFLDATVRNFSNRPVFDVEIDAGSDNTQVRLGRSSVSRIAVSPSEPTSGRSM